MTTTPTRVGAGPIEVAAACPECGRLELIYAQLSPVYTHAPGDTATLKLRAKSKPLDHLCSPDTPVDLFTATDDQADR